METYNAVALSTSHITEDDNGALRVASFQGNMVMERESGFFIKLYMDEPAHNFREDYSESLKNVIRFAFDNDFQMIELDSDAEAIEELDQHDW